MGERDDGGGERADAGSTAVDSGGDSTADDAGDRPTEEPYEVFVQWERGQPHEYAETVNAPDAEMALLLAKRNVDVRAEPLEIRVAPRRAFLSTAPDDPTLTPSTDRSYRNVASYARQLEGPDE